MTPSSPRDPASHESVRERLRAAKTLDDAKSATAYLSPEEFVHAVAEHAREQIRRQRAPRARRRLALDLAPSIFFLLLPVVAILLEQRGALPPGAWSVVNFLSQIGNLVNIFVIVRRRRLDDDRDNPATRFPPLLIARVDALVSASAVPDLLRLITSNRYAASEPTRRSLRAALLRLLPRVTPDDAGAFSVDDFKDLCDLATTKAKPGKNPVFHDAELATAAWLALAALAGAAPIDEPLAKRIADGASATAGDAKSDQVRAAASEFLATVDILKAKQR